MKKTKQKSVAKKKNLTMEAVLAVAAVAVILIFIFVLSQQKKSPVVAAEKTNSEVFSALAKGGIKNSNTVTPGNLVKVSYQLPSSMTKENAELYVLGVLSSLTPEKEKVVISTYSGENKLGEIEVSMSDVLKYKNRQITLEEFRKRFIVVQIGKLH